MKKDLDELFEDMKEEDINEIAESYPVLTDEEKERMFSMSERKYNINNDDGIDTVSAKHESNEVSGVEHYTRPVWKKVAAVAASVAILGSGAFGVMRMNHSFSRIGRGTSARSSKNEATEPSTDQRGEDMDDYMDFARPVLDRWLDYENNVLNSMEVDLGTRKDVSFQTDSGEDIVVPYYLYTGTRFTSLSEVEELEKSVFTEDYIDNSYIVRSARAFIEVKEEGKLYRTVERYSGNSAPIFYAWTDDDFTIANVTDTYFTVDRKMTTYEDSPVTTVRFEFRYVDDIKDWRISSVDESTADDSSILPDITANNGGSSDTSLSDEEREGTALTLAYGLVSFYDAVYNSNGYDTSDPLTFTFAGEDMDPYVYYRYTGGLFSSTDDVMALASDLYTSEYLENRPLTAVIPDAYDGMTVDSISAYAPPMFIQTGDGSLYYLPYSEDIAPLSINSTVLAEDSISFTYFDDTSFTADIYAYDRSAPNELFTIILKARYDSAAGAYRLESAQNLSHSATSAGLTNESGDIGEITYPPEIAGLLTDSYMELMHIVYHADVTSTGVEADSMSFGGKTYFKAADDRFSDTDMLREFAMYTVSENLFDSEFDKYIGDEYTDTATAPEQRFIMYNGQLYYDAELIKTEYTNSYNDKEATVVSFDDSTIVAKRTCLDDSGRTHELTFNIERNARGRWRVDSVADSAAN